jgi:cytoskeletal protein CcmA (bactofilin family)
MFRRRRKPKAPMIDSLLSATTRVHGDLLFSGGLHLDGGVTGSIRATGDASRLVLGSGAVIAGSVEAQTVELHGVVRGDIVASGRVTLGPKARVEGDVRYGELEVAAGALIKGKLTRAGGTDGQGIT